MKRQNLIALNVWCYISNYFALFVNPVSRGPNFKWEKFPEMAQDYCKTMWAFSGLSDTSRNKRKELEFISKISKEIAENLIKRAGLI